MKTLILSPLGCALNIKTKILILLLALTCSARATFIETGRITFSGDFTLNHLYDFNNQSAQPFGKPARVALATFCQRQVGKSRVLARERPRGFPVSCQVNDLKHLVHAFIFIRRNGFLILVLEH